MKVICDHAGEHKVCRQCEHSIEHNYDSFFCTQECENYNGEVNFVKCIPVEQSKQKGEENMNETLELYKEFIGTMRMKHCVDCDEDCNFCHVESRIKELEEEGQRLYALLNNQSGDCCCK